MSSIIVCDTEMNLSYCFLGYQGLTPVNQQGAVIVTNGTRESRIVMTVMKYIRSNAKGLKLKLMKSVPTAAH